MRLVIFQGGFQVRSETTVLMVTTMDRIGTPRAEHPQPSAVSSWESCIHQDSQQGLYKPHSKQGLDSQILSHPEQCSLNQGLPESTVAIVNDWYVAVDSNIESDMGDKLVIVIPDSSGLVDVN